jgi:nucleoside-diphosphate-sugar epimerase
MTAPPRRDLYLGIEPSWRTLAYWGNVNPIGPIRDDPVRRNPNISRAQKLLGGWTPVVPLEKGIAETIAYFRGVVG